MFLLITLSCGSDVSIMKKYEPEDTSSAIRDTFEPDMPIEGVSGYLHYHLKQVACPSCMGEPQELAVELSLSLHEPITDSHTLWIPQQGECTNTLQYITPSTNPISLGDILNVQSIHALSLYQSAPGSYFTTLYESQYDRDYNYTVARNDTVLFTFQSIHGFDFIEPYTLFWVDPSYAFETPISRNGTTFWWGPSGDQNQIFNITIAIYSSDGLQLLGYVSCSGADSGQLTVPGQYLSIFPPGSLTAVHLTRHKVKLEPSSFLNSYIETHMEWEVVGTGQIQ